MQNIVNNSLVLLKMIKTRVKVDMKLKGRLLPKTIIINVAVVVCFEYQKGIQTITHDYVSR